MTTLDELIQQLEVISTAGGGSYPVHILGLDPGPKTVFVQKMRYPDPSPGRLYLVRIEQKKD